MSLFSVYGLVDVEVDAASASTRATFSRELAPTVERTGSATISIEVDPTIGHDPDERFGVTGARLGERFLYPDGRGHYCELDADQLADPGWTSTAVRLCCPEFSANVLLEWVVLPLAYFPLGELGWTPLHASGIAYPDERRAVIFAAWSGVGKTNLLLSRLAEQTDAVYLGDDIVLVHVDGLARPSTRTVSAYGYNRRLVGKVPLSVGFRMRLGEAVRRAALAGLASGRFQSSLLVVSSGLANHRVDIARARSSADFAPCDVTTHVRCVSTTGADPPAVRKIDGLRGASAAAHLAVLDYEFIQFRRLIETWRWATRASRDPWASLRARWERNLEDFFGVPRSYYELSLPQTTDPKSTFAQAWAELDRALVR